VLGEDAEWKVWRCHTDDRGRCQAAFQSAPATAGRRRFGCNVSSRPTSLDEPVDLAAKLELLDGPYAPGIVGYYNDNKLAVVKVNGDFVWHRHDDTDDFFLVLRGHLTIQLRDRDVELREGELFVVPRGVEHRPRADKEAHVLLIEPRGTINTGDAGGALTAPERDI
jgi:mannose-6-phosphate isomerase-like protein (cupin superfamily)